MSLVDASGLVSLAERNPVCQRILILRQFLESAKRGANLPAHWDFFPPTGKYVGAVLVERITDAVVAREPTTWAQARHYTVEALIEQPEWKAMSHAEKDIAKDIVRGIFVWLEGG